jgi:hypothetical protein
VPLTSTIFAFSLHYRLPKVDVQPGDATQTLFNTASTTLSSKIVNVHRDQMARIAVRADAFLFLPRALTPIKQRRRGDFDVLVKQTHSR